MKFDTFEKFDIVRNINQIIKNQISTLKKDWNKIIVKKKIVV